MTWGLSAAAAAVRPASVSAIGAAVTMAVVSGLLAGGLVGHRPEHIAMVPLGSASLENGPLKLRMQDGKAVAVPLAATDLSPGTQVAQRYRLDGPEGLPFKVTVRTSNIRDAENGCNAEEARVDSSCGISSGGELSGRAELSIFVSLVPQGKACVFTHSMPLVEARRVRDLEGASSGTMTVPRHQDACIDVRLALSTETGNETQSDSTLYDLIWRAESFHG